MAGQSGELTQLVFVVGASRSGTTLLGNLLGNSEAIVLLPETHFFQNVVAGPREMIDQDRGARVISSLLNRVENGPWTKAKDDTFLPKASEVCTSIFREDRLVSAFDIFQKTLSQVFSKEAPKYIVEQTPANVFIMHLLPENSCVIFQMIRDPRAVIMSQKKRHSKYFGAHSQMSFFHFIRLYLNYSLFTTSRLWQGACHAGERYSLSNHFWVRYEDMVKTPEVTLGNVFAKLGLHFTDDLLETDYNDSSHRVSNASGGINSASADTWRSSIKASEEAVMLDILCEQMLTHRYLTEKNSSSQFVKLWKGYYFGQMVLKGALALGFNFDKMKFYLRNLNP